MCIISLILVQCACSAWFLASWPSHSRTKPLVGVLENVYGLLDVWAEALTC